VGAVFHVFVAEFSVPCRNTRHPLNEEIEAVRTLRAIDCDVQEEWGELSISSYQMRVYPMSGDVTTGQVAYKG